MNWELKILSEVLLVKIGPKGSIKYYRKLTKNNKLKVNDFIYVESALVYPKSKVIIKRECAKCGAVKELSRDKATPLCNKCGREEYNKTIKKKEYNCVDCGSIKSYNGKYCKNCAIKHSGIFHRNSKEWVHIYLAKYDMHTKEEVNNKTTRDKIEITCNKCGKTSNILVNNIRRFKGCKHCTVNIGKNHPRWNPELDDHYRTYKRRNKELKKWAKLVKEKYDYTCDICKKRGGYLESHHLNGYASYPDSRYDLNNGVCLCKECHIEFHKTFGYFTFTSGDYLKFKKAKGV